MPVIYNSKNIIPGPMAIVVKNPELTEDGQIIGARFQVVLEGKLVINKGSPTSSGSFWESESGYPNDESVASDSYLNAMLRKMDALRGLFHDEGKTLKILPYDGAEGWSCNPRVRAIDFQRGQTISWYNQLDYRVTLDCDEIRGYGGFNEASGFAEKVEKASESWAIAPADEFNLTYRLTHNVNAKGKRHYDSGGILRYEAWQQASGYVMNRIGLGIDATRLAANGVLGLAAYNAYNYTRNQNIGELDGTFAVEETWVCVSGANPAIEEYTVTARQSDFNKKTVGVEGTIRGLETKNNTTYATTASRWTNASAKWATVQGQLFTRAQTISALTLHTEPLNTSVGYNDLNGVITYNYEYNNRPNNAISGALWERIEFQTENPADLFASIPIIGKPDGPIIQNLGTVTQRRRTLVIEAMMSGSTQGFLPIHPNTNYIISGYRPATSTVQTERDVENWSPTDGRYSRNVTWAWLP